MYRCKDCKWFARPKTKRISFRGCCVVLDEKRDMLTKRCKEYFERKEL